MICSIFSRRSAAILQISLAPLLLLAFGFSAHAQTANFSSTTNLLEIPYVLIDGAPFNAKLSRGSDGRFSILSYAATAPIASASYVPSFSSATGKLTLASVTVDGQAYSGVMGLGADNRLTVLSIGGSPFVGGSYGLISGAEVPVQLAYPQTGSTADVARATPQGIYRSSTGNLLFVDSASYLAANNGFSSYYFGSLKFNNNAWTTGPDGTVNFGGFTSSAAGSGTYSPSDSFAGYIGSYGTTTATYDAANALAVSLPSLVGVWNASYGSDGAMTIAVNSDGSFSGRVTRTVNGTLVTRCSASGSISMRDPGSVKNMLLFSMVLSGGSDCPFEQGRPYQGLGGIVYVAAGNYVGNGYKRSLTFVASTTAGSTLVVPFSKL